MNYSLLAVALLAVAASGGVQADEPAKRPFQTPPEAVEAWKDMRFGMFIHWGPSSLTGGEISWSRGKKTPVAEYDLLYRKFNPTEFNADEWPQIAKNAGMKYLVITTKHHDGFCLWPSKHTDYHIGNTPLKRDVLKELAEACKKHGVKFGTYYSVADWVHPDFPQGGPGTKRPNPNLDRYFEYLRSQLTELFTNYGPVCTVWFDGPFGKPHHCGPTEALIISWPEQFQQNTVVQPPVELADILKTSLELAHASDEDKRSTGSHSLLPLLTGHGDYGRRVAFAEIEGYVVAVCDGYRYIQGADASLLFNETTDPDNLIDLSGKEPERVALMSKYITDWLKATGPVLPKNSH